MKQGVKELDYSSLARRIYRAAAEQRRPVAGAIAITYRCNLSCVHCYLRNSRAVDEWPTEKWLEVIDELQHAGCLWLLLTGGEPLFRSDFERIYLHAKKRGMLVAVFTNGTLIDDSVIELFRQWPPYVVEISLYGYTHRAYGDVTGVPEARDLCLAAVRRLTRAAVPVRLKTMALRQNVHELPNLQHLAESLDVAFRFDPNVSSTLDGSPVPCSTRLDHHQIVGLEEHGKDRLKSWAEFCHRHGDLPPRKTLFFCDGGKTSFFIGPDGSLSLCIYDTPVYDLNRGSFREGWEGAVRKRRIKPLPEKHPCAGCRELTCCDVCPPLARMETGDELGLPDDLCRLGKARSRMVAGYMGSRKGAPQKDGI